MAKQKDTIFSEKNVYDGWWKKRSYSLFGPCLNEKCEEKIKWSQEKNIWFVAKLKNQNSDIRTAAYQMVGPKRHMLYIKAI